MTREQGYLTKFSSNKYYWNTRSIMFQLRNPLKMAPKQCQKKECVITHILNRHW